jgi:hypothetical protein
VPDDRYSTITREVPVDRPRNTVFVPGATYDPAANFTDPNATGDLNSQHRVSLHPAGFRMRERGAIDATVVHAYRCPVHGDFDMRVSRADVPNALPCQVPHGDQRTILALAPWKHDAVYGDIWVSESGLDFRIKDGVLLCGEPSPWAGSSCGIGHSSGEVTC